eukprot:1180843-Prorocentrum_minimum.AAC.2
MAMVLMLRAMVRMLGSKVWMLGALVWVLGAMVWMLGAVVWMLGGWTYQGRDRLLPHKLGKHVGSELAEPYDRLSGPLLTADRSGCYQPDQSGRYLALEEHLSR